MNSSEASIADQPLVAYGTEDSCPAANFESEIDHAPRSLDGAVLGRKNLQRPLRPMIHALRPFASNRVKMRPDGFEFDDHVGDRVLDLRMVGHRAREGHRTLALCRSD